MSARAVADFDRGADRGLAVQVRSPLDDGQFPRRADHRFRHDRFLLKTFPNFRLGVDRRIDRCGPARDADLAHRPVPRARAYAALGGTVVSGADRRAVAEGSGAGLGAVPGRSIMSRASCAPASTACHSSRRGLDGLPIARSPEKLKKRRRRNLRAGGEAAAYRHGAGRIELRCPEHAGHAGAGRLPGAVPLLRRQEPLVPGGRHRRTDLVHRIQCADGTVGALVRALQIYVTRIAADRVERGLPQTLRRCGYKTFSLYPAPGVPEARGFQHSAGIEPYDRFHRNRSARPASSPTSSTTTGAAT